MNGFATTDTGKRTWTPARLWQLVALVAVVLFLAANVHLIYVAAMSQPACVEHLRQGQVQGQINGQGVARRGQFAAAQSSCSPLSTERTGSP